MFIEVKNGKVTNVSAQQDRKKKLSPCETPNIAIGWVATVIGEDAEGRPRYACAPQPEIVPPFDVDVARAAAKQSVIRFANRLTYQLTGQYPDAERAAWPEKQREAEAFLQGGFELTPAPILVAIVEAEGVALADDGFLDAVTAKSKSVVRAAQYFLSVAATVEALRINADAAIDTATTQEEIELALAAALEIATLQAQTLGLEV